MFVEEEKGEELPTKRVTNSFPMEIILGSTRSSLNAGIKICGVALTVTTAETSLARNWLWATYEM